MIALQVKLNGKKLCLAGTEDLSVLNAIINAIGTLGNKTPKKRDGTPDLLLTVGGLTRRKSGADYHLTWVKFKKLSIGDRIEVEIVETAVADAPTGNVSPPSQVPLGNDLRAKLHFGGAERGGEA